MSLLVIPFVLIGGLASMFSRQTNAALVGIGFLLFAILAPVVYGAMGFLIGAAFSWLYNVVAKRWGGIQIELEESRKAASSGDRFGLV